MPRICFFLGPDSLTEFDWKQAKITLYSPLAFTYISPVNVSEIYALPIAVRT